MTQKVGPEPARRALEKSYAGGIIIDGYFPVDGGSNYRADAAMGGLGEKTVEVEFTEESAEDDEQIMAGAETRALVYKPISGDPYALQNFEAYAVHGIYASDVAKLPWELGHMLLAEEGAYLTYKKL